jgi:hypothetical protein
MAKGRPPSPNELAVLKKNKAPNWVKGQSGNPDGYPKGQKNRATILRELLGLTLKQNGKAVENPLDPNQKKMTIEQAVNIALIQKALKGNIEAIKEIQDTMHGKIKDKTELTGADGQPLAFIVHDDLK